MISKTATQTGFGTDRNKRVIGLTTEERAHVRSSGVVAYDSGRLSGGRHGTPWRIAIEGTNRDFYPRVPTALQLAEIVNPDGLCVTDKLAAWVAANNNGEGYAVGDESQTPLQAAQSDGLAVLDTSGDDVLAADSAGSLVMICDLHGPWACSV